MQAGHSARLKTNELLQDITRYHAADCPLSCLQIRNMNGSSDNACRALHERGKHVANIAVQADAYGAMKVIHILQNTLVRKHVAGCLT